MNGLVETVAQHVARDLTREPLQLPCRPLPAHKPLAHVDPPPERSFAAAFASLVDAGHVEVLQKLAAAYHSTGDAPLDTHKLAAARAEYCEFTLAFDALLQSQKQAQVHVQDGVETTTAPVSFTPPGKWSELLSQAPSHAFLSALDPLLKEANPSLSKDADPSLPKHADPSLPKDADPCLPKDADPKAERAPPSANAKEMMEMVYKRPLDSLHRALPASRRKPRWICATTNSSRRFTSFSRISSKSTGTWMPWILETRGKARTWMPWILDTRGKATRHILIFLTNTLLRNLQPLAVACGIEQVDLLPTLVAGHALNWQ